MATDTQVKSGVKGQGATEQKSIELKRQVVIKSIVTKEFRQQANAEFTEELKLVEAQIQQLENQYQSTMRQVEEMGRQGQDVSKQLMHLNGEVQERRAQLENAKIQVSRNLANVEKAADGEHVITGNLENYVSLSVGDNIYDKLRNAEIIIEDGVIKEIIG